MMNAPDRHVLIVEDNMALASVVGFNLEQAGFRVTLVNDGREAWRCAQEETFDLIITDQQMPEMSGSELCNLLRQSEQYSAVPIILLTAKGLELDLARMEKEFGVNASFVKPFSPNEVVQAVEEFLTAVS